MNEHPNTQIWIAGDLNLPNINWNNNSVEGFSYPILLCNIFLEFYIHMALHKQLILLPGPKNLWIYFVSTDHLL